MRYLVLIFCLVAVAAAQEENLADHMLEHFARATQVQSAVVSGDLAGVDKEHIHVDVLPSRIRISGERKPPAPTRDSSSRCLEVLTMEIESGRFGREIVLPAEVDRNRVTAKQENGLLWIVLPIARD